MRLRDVACPNSSRKTVRRPVGALDDLIEILERNDAHHRTEDLFLGDFHLVLNVGKDGRLNEIATVSDPFTSAHKLRAFVPARIYVSHYFVELCLVDLGTLFGVG